MLIDELTLSVPTNFNMSGLDDLQYTKYPSIVKVLEAQCKNMDELSVLKGTPVKNARCGIERLK